MIDSRAHRIKVLLVHSDQAQRRVLVKKLGNSFDVFGVSTVEEAIAQASQSKPGLDLRRLRWDGRSPADGAVDDESSSGAAAAHSWVCPRFAT